VILSRRWKRFRSIRPCRKFYTPDGVKAMHESPKGRLIALQRRNLRAFSAGAVGLCGTGYLEWKISKGRAMLDKAEKIHWVRNQGFSCLTTITGLSALPPETAKEADNCIERMRAIIKETPNAPSLGNTFSPRADLICTFSDLTMHSFELLEAQRSVLHPIERHVTAYWIAKAHEGAGVNKRRPNRFYQIVAADAIPTRYVSKQLWR